ncbi:MAG: ABC transporter ATP-binding protein [Sciscionella sp.]
MTELTLRGVCAGYHGRPVLSGVDITVSAGSWLAVIGANGTGKSTLLKAVAGLVRHTGEILVGGHDLGTLGDRARAKSMAYAPQSPVLPEGLTVTDYVLLGRTPHLGALARESRGDLDVATDALRRMDLLGLADRTLRTLSGGERQRAVLARVLAQQADVLLLDEPTTGLDIGHAQALLELVDRLRIEDGTTVVSTLHDLTLAAQYADQLLLLDDGRLAAAGTPAEVLTPQRLAHHYDARVEVLTTGTGNLVISPYRPPVATGPSRSPQGPNATG